jgi:hypothetical protein
MSVPVKIYRSVTYQEGFTPSNPNVTGDPVINPLNPNGEPVGHNPVTIGSPANGLSITDDQVLTYDGSTIPTAAVIGRYDIDTSGTTAPVGTKDIRYNNATQISATQLFISDITEDNIDVDLFLSLIKQGSALVIQDRDDHLNYQTYEVSGTPTFASDTWTFPVTFKDSGGTGTTNFANNRKVLLSALSSGSGTIGGSGTANYVARFTGASTIGNSQIIDNGTNVLINKTVDNGNKLQLSGNFQISSGDIIVDNLRGLYFDNDNRVKMDSSFGWEISSWSKTLFKKNVEIENQIYSPVNAKGNSGSGTVTFNWNDSNIQSVTLTGSCTFAFSNPQSGASYQIIVSQDGTGGRVVTLPTVTWQGGSAPSLPTGINNQYLLRFYYNGSAYFGELVDYQTDQQLITVTNSNTSIGAVKYNGTTKSSGVFYGGGSAPSNTSATLSFDGWFRASKLDIYGDGYFSGNITTPKFIQAQEFYSSKVSSQQILNNQKFEVALPDKRTRLITLRCTGTTNSHATVIGTNINGTITFSVLISSNMTVSAETNALGFTNTSGSNLFYDIASINFNSTEPY